MSIDLTSNEIETYAGWLARGRTVIGGTKAEHYGGTASGKWYGLFRIDQTMEAPGVTLKDIVETKTAEEHKGAHASTNTKPKAIVEYEDGIVQVWVGNSKKGIGMLKKGKYRFEPARHRWIVRRPDPQVVVDGLTKAGFNVETKIQGEVVI